MTLPDARAGGRHTVGKGTNTWFVWWRCLTGGFQTPFSNKSPRKKSHSQEPMGALEQVSGGPGRVRGLLALIALSQWSRLCSAGGGNTQKG